MSPDPDLVEELAELVSSVRALAEWHESTGSSGLLTESSPQELLTLLATGPSAPGRGSAGARPLTPPAAAPQAPQVRPAVAPQAPPARSAAQTAPGPMTMSSMPFPSPSPSPSPFTFPSSVPASVSAPASVPVSAPVSAPEGPRVGILTPVTGSETLEERRVKLAMIAEEVRACTRCGLHAQRKQTVFARGNPASELVFVGEGPGADEDAQGFPFVGKAGQLLDRMIAAMGYGRDDVYICNIVKCRPPENRKPEPYEMGACTPYVTAQLALINPKVIVALGATAMEGLTGIAGGITRMRGKWKLYKGKTPIMPTFHPAYLLRQPAAKREVWDDLKEVLRQLGKTPPPQAR